jgi:hypothetical protein
MPAASPAIIIHAAKYFMVCLSTDLFVAFIAQDAQKHNEKDCSICSILFLIAKIVLASSRLDVLDTSPSYESSLSSEFLEIFVGRRRNLHAVAAFLVTDHRGK